MKKLISILVTLFIATSVLADDAPIHVKKGDVVQTEGWLFTILQEQQIRSSLMEADFNKNQVVILKSNISILNNEITSYQAISDKYRLAWINSEADLTKSLQREGRDKLWYTILGSVMTIGAGLTINHLNR